MRVEEEPEVSISLGGDAVATLHTWRLIKPILMAGDGLVLPVPNPPWPPHSKALAGETPAGL